MNHKGGEIADVLMQFRSNRDTDSVSDNDSLVKMSGDTWQIRHNGQIRTAATLADIPEVFRQIQQETVRV